MLEIGFVTDEISVNLQDAIKTGVSWGVKKYEIRVIEGQRIPAISKQDIQDLLDLKKEYGLEYTALSPGIFKLPIGNDKELERELNETLPRTIEIAQQVGAGMIITFGFQKANDEPSENKQTAVSILQKAGERAQESDIILAVENEPGFWCDTGKNTADILTQVDSPVIGANWDPANAIGTSEKPYPDGYNALKPYIKNVHAKDTDTHALDRCVLVGKGLVDWQGQIRALLEDQIVPHITIETHVEPLKENSLQNIETIKKYITNVST